MYVIEVFFTGSSEPSRLRYKYAFDRFERLFGVVNTTVKVLDVTSVIGGTNHDIWILYTCLERHTIIRNDLVVPAMDTKRWDFDVFQLVETTGMVVVLCDGVGTACAQIVDRDFIGEVGVEVPPVGGLLDRLKIKVEILLNLVKYFILVI